MDVLVCLLILFLNSNMAIAKSSCCSDENLPGDEVEVKFYYETHCRLSKYVYLTNITQLVKTIGSAVTIHTYPFGNGWFLDAAQTEVECQHGPRECYGNKLHACAIKILKYLNKYVNFNFCLMQNGSNDKAVEDCGRAQNVDSESVKQCAKSPEGQNLLIQNGKETLKVRPGQNYVPYILINGKELDLVHETLLHQVCKAFQNPPDACVAF